MFLYTSSARIALGGNMAQVLVPGVAQTALTGTVGGHPFANIWHYKLNVGGQNWTISQLNSLANAIMAGIGTFIAPLTSSDTIFQQCSAVDIGTATPAEGISNPGVHQGTQGTTQPPPSTCVVVSFQTQDRYRGGHPRTYMPPMAATSMDTTEDQWTAALIGQYSTAFTNLQDGVFSAVPGITQVAVRYNYSYTDDPVRHKYIKTRVSVHSTPTVLNWIPKQPIGTQRRRVKIGG